MKNRLVRFMAARVETLLPTFRKVNAGEDPAMAGGRTVKDMFTLTTHANSKKKKAR